MNIRVQTDRQRDRETAKQIDRQPNRQKDRQSNRFVKKIKIERNQIKLEINPNFKNIIFEIYYEVQT